MAVTIKDVAQAAGVSISTVSKVLNGHYSISEKTVQNVQAVMRELNYYPSANAQSFASGANHTVVLLANLGPNMAFQNPHMFEIIAGMEESLRKRGYRLMLQGTDETLCQQPLGHAASIGAGGIPQPDILLLQPDAGGCQPLF